MLQKYIFSAKTGDENDQCFLYISHLQELDFAWIVL